MARPTIRLGAWQLSLLAAVFIAVANNGKLFSMLAERLDLASINGISFLLTITVLVIVVLNALFLGLGVGRMLKPTIAVTMIAAAVLGYFTNDMGVVFDKEMLRNVMDTFGERNAGEALELGSWALLRHVFIFGLLPAFAVTRVEVRPSRPVRGLASRVIAVLAGFALFTGLALSNYKYISYFAVEHRDLRVNVIPVYPLISAVKIAQIAWHTEPEFTVIGVDAVQDKPTDRRTVGIMVVGETARSDHFSLNGYERVTNPMLERQQDLLFFDVHSCGTSTAYSVPCMFFLRGHERYSPDLAKAESNVLDVLQSVGVRTVWIDNNSSCKHVCDRIESANLRQNETGDGTPPNSIYDMALVREMQRYIDDTDDDLLIVLHMMGSHGPAYSRRYPAQFARFLPFCDKQSPTECPVGDVVNAYDNSIVYTDYVLSQIIGILGNRADDFDSFMVYASDHGESLGEDGIYLHGMPYRLAPRAQTEVPLVVWLSEKYRLDHALPAQNAEAASDLSHDYIPHTLLGLFDVEGDAYLPEYDLFRSTRLPTDLPGPVTTSVAAPRDPHRPT